MVSYYTNDQNLINYQALQRQSHSGEDYRTQEFLKKKETHENQPNAGPPLLKKLISTRKLLNTKQKLKIDTTFQEKAPIQKEAMKHNLLKMSKEAEDDMHMKVAIKYLRNLGKLRRNGNETSIKEELTISHDDCSSKDLTLSDANNHDNPVNLNAEEQEYIDFAKEYRQYDEKRFKAFQVKCQEERRRSLRIDRSALENQIQVSTLYPNFGIKLQQTKEGSSVIIDDSPSKNSIHDKSINNLGKSPPSNTNAFYQKPQTARNSNKKIDLYRFDSTKRTETKQEPKVIHQYQHMPTQNSDSDSKSLISQQSLLTKFQKMKSAKKKLIDPRHQSFLLKQRPVIHFKDQSHEEGKNTYQKSNYTRYVPKQVTVKNFSSIIGLKELKRNLQELSVSVEEGLINEDPRTATARMNRKQDSYQEFTSFALSRTKEKKVYSERKKPPKQVIKTCTNKDNQNFRNKLKNDSIKQIFLNLSSLVNDLDSSSNEQLSNLAQFDEISNQNGSGKGARKQSKCISERDRNKYRLIDNPSSRDSTDSPPNEDRQSLQSQRLENKNPTNNGHRFAIILQQIETSFTDDDVDVDEDQ